jgi:hypothetical protein
VSFYTLVVVTEVSTGYHSAMLAWIMGENDWGRVKEPALADGKMQQEAGVVKGHTPPPLLPAFCFLPAPRKWLFATASRLLDGLSLSRIRIYAIK